MTTGSDSSDRGLDFAVERAKELIASNRPEDLDRLLVEHPALLRWRGQGDDGEVLLQSTTSYANFPGAEHEDVWNRVECAEVLLARGASVDPRVALRLLDTGAHRMLALFAERGVLPDNLRTRAALGSLEGVRGCFDGDGELLDPARPDPGLLEAYPGAERDWPSPQVDLEVIEDAFLYACRLGKQEVATFLLDACSARDSALASRVDGHGKPGFVTLMLENVPKLARSGRRHSRVGSLGLVERAYLEVELLLQLDRCDAESLASLLDREPELTGPDFESEAMGFVEVASYSPRTLPLLETWVARSPNLSERGRASGTRAISYALEYGHRDYVPVLQRLAPVAEDLPHAAGLGDMEAVQRWFRGASSPDQETLDRALAWSVVNGSYDIADFLLERGADIQTRWSTHEPASILHECAFAGRFEACEYLVSRGIDLAIKDARFDSTAEGWAEFAGHTEIAEFLRKAREARRSGS